MRDLKTCSYWRAHWAYHNADPSVRDIEAQAQTLAKSIRSRLSGLLSRDPRVTARALQIVDRKLPAELHRELGRLLEDSGDGTEEGGVEEGNVLVQALAVSDTAEG